MCFKDPKPEDYGVLTNFLCNFSARYKSKPNFEMLFVAFLL